VKTLRELYAETPAAEFGPLRLKAARQVRVNAKLARSECNRRTNLVRRMFKWAASEEQVPGVRRIELLCDLVPGDAGINSAKVRRLRAQICQQRWQPRHADQLTLDEAADILEGIRRVPLEDSEQVQHDFLYHGLATLDTVEVGLEVVQVTGLSCKVIAGTTPTACPDANPVLPPSLLPGAERAIRRLYLLPAGATIHWVGHDSGVRNRCPVSPECSVRRAVRSAPLGGGRNSFATNVCRRVARACCSSHYGRSWPPSGRRGRCAQSGHDW
jgi:hypothetical protein